MTVANGPSRGAMERLKSALQRWLSIVPPAITEVEDTDSTLRNRGYDSSREAFDYFQRGRTGHTDDLIHIPVSSRSRRINLSRVLYESDPRIKDIIVKSSSETLKRGFSYAVHDTVPEGMANRVLGALDELVARTNLMKNIMGWHKAALVDGDLFLQIVLDGNGDPVRVNYQNPLNFQRCSNDNDLFPEPDRSFISYRDGTLVEDDGTLTELVGSNTMKVKDAETRVRDVYDWLEIVHARVDDMPGRRYGRPLLESAMDSARYVRVAELDLGVRRKAKSAPKDVWIVGTPEHPQPPDSVLMDVLDQLTRRRANVQRGRELDIGVRYPVKAEHFPGDSSIGVVNDINHHLDSIYAASPIPKQASGYVDSINRDVIPAVHKMLNDNIEGQRTWLADQILIPVAERLLWYSGVPVEPGMVYVDFPPNEHSLEDFATVAAALANLAKGGLTTNASTGRLLERMMPEVFSADEYLMEQAEDMAAKQAAMSMAMEQNMEQEDAEVVDA